MAELKKTSQAKLETEKSAAFDKGYNMAMQQVAQKAKTTSKDMLKMAQAFEKDFAKLTTAKVPKKATQSKKTNAKKTARTEKANKAADTSTD